jgi:hypothetical protein
LVIILSLMDFFANDTNHIELAVAGK